MEWPHMAIADEQLRKLRQCTDSIQYTDLILSMTDYSLTTGTQTHWQSYNETTCTMHSSCVSS